MVLDVGFKVVVRIFQAGGIDKEEAVVDTSHDIIASRSLLAGNDSDIFMRKAIQKAGFASVGLADESDDRKFLHESILT